MLPSPTGLALGLLLGMRHALEPDHLAAVSTLVARNRDPRAGVLVGALWGVGHSLSLLVVGVVLHVMQAELPATLGALFEACVAVMLIGLGGRSLLRSLSLGPRGPRLSHSHGGTEHVHEGQHDHVHFGGFTLARQPLLVGLLHGLAGSGALTALAFSNIGTANGRLAFVSLFGLGSVLGMAALTGLVGLPIARLSQSERASRSLFAVTGALSLAVGLFWLDSALAGL